MTNTSTRWPGPVSVAVLAAVSLTATATASMTSADQLDRLSPYGNASTTVTAPPDRLDPSASSAQTPVLRMSPTEHPGNRVVFGVRLDLASGTGSFAACCAVDDAGPASVRITSYVPDEDRGTATFEATNTFTGTKGSITIRLHGTTGPLSGDHHVARARWRVADGTGAYANLTGRGTLTAVTDQTTGALTAIDIGSVDRPREVDAADQR